MNKVWRIFLYVKLNNLESSSSDLDRSSWAIVRIVNDASRPGALPCNAFVSIYDRAVRGLFVRRPLLLTYATRRRFPFIEFQQGRES